jgi:hypothetical protein
MKVARQILSHWAPSPVGQRAIAAQPRWKAFQLSASVSRRLQRLQVASRADEDDLEGAQAYWVSLSSHATASDACMQTSPLCVHM